jgi:RNA polymerase sigma-70 factor (ECF subfamily)
MGHDPETALRTAFEEYSDPLFRHAYFRLSDRERAFDLVQDTFLKAWDHIRDGEEVRSYKSFLYRILHNLIIDEYRRKKSGSLDALLEDETRSNAIESLLSEGSFDDTASEIDSRLLVGSIRERMHDLPVQYREIITMRYIDELEIAEIADMLSVSENVVSVRIHRALAKLRTLCDNIRT